MRRLAWTLVVLGAVIALVGTLGVKALNDNADERAYRAVLESVDLRAMERAMGRLSRGLPLAPRTSLAVPLGIGAAVSAFGVLLLAVRPPERRAPGRGPS